MDLNELENQVNLLQYHLQLLANCIDSDEHPVESLILNMNWNEKQIDRAHDIFQKYDQLIDSKSKIVWSKFEHELRDEFAIGYQTVKAIVIAFYKNHQWVDVCYQYAMSFEPTTPIEFHQITRNNKFKHSLNDLYKK
ncbi:MULTISPECIES: hypothetical protein [unclassified Psychrobacter]|uniref:hypothetical protein n=1 Tax=unclassified Psychrobacter TaxID=196806 RepID=UPI00047259BB|nr:MULTISPECIES: hypothetical protein [unclassified Psychrobacter]